MNDDDKLVVIQLKIAPVAKPRMTQRDKWLNPPRPAVAKYRLFCTELRNQLSRAAGNQYPLGLDDISLILPHEFDVVFFVPMPESWSHSKKMSMNCKPHQQTPDRDNFLKAFQDAIWRDDSKIYDGRVGKYWATVGSIVVTYSLGEAL